MLNSTRVIDYIKTELGYPHVLIELSDQEILEYVQKFTLKTFSEYYPQKKKLVLNLNLDANRVPNIQNEYYLTEPEGLEILNVVHTYFSQSNLYIFGHPPFGPMSLGEIKSWALDVEIAGMINYFSSFSYTYEFRHPNVLRISPAPTGESFCIVEYERQQPTDFSGVSNTLQMYFLELALADIMIVIGRLRKKYGAGGLKTPWGDIPLDTEILEEGKEKKKDIIEKFTANILSNVTIEIG